jgi:hypothetical protein
MSITPGNWINIKYNNKIYKGFVFSLEGNEAVVNAYVPIIGPSSFIELKYDVEELELLNHV